MMGLSGSLSATFTTTKIHVKINFDSLKLYRVYLASLSVSGGIFWVTGY